MITKSTQKKRNGELPVCKLQFCREPFRKGEVINLGLANREKMTSLGVGTQDIQPKAQTVEDTLKHKHKHKN